MRSKIPVFLVSASVLLFAACSSSATTTPTATASVTTAACQPGAGGSATVTIQGTAFHPTELPVKAGTTVTWTNQDPFGHTATADDASTFDCGFIAGGDSISFTFARAGTYAYHCAIHTFMKATITVTS